MSWTKQSTTSTNTSSNKWQGKTFNFIGDSITVGTGSTGGNTGYVYLIKNDLQLAASNNYGIGGSTVADTANPFYTRVSTMADADVFFVLGGTNDFSLNVQLGNLYTLDANNQKVASTDTSTFYGAYHQLAKNLIAKFPTRRIILMTPTHRGNYASQPNDFNHNANGNYIRDFVDAVIEIGKWYGFPVIDLFNLTNMQPNESSQTSLYYADQLHPNDKGHQRVANTIEAYLNCIALD